MPIFRISSEPRQNQLNTSLIIVVFARKGNESVYQVFQNSLFCVHLILISFPHRLSLYMSESRINFSDNSFIILITTLLSIFPILIIYLKYNKLLI